MQVNINALTLTFCGRNKIIKCYIILMYIFLGNCTLYFLYIVFCLQYVKYVYKFLFFSSQSLVKNIPFHQIELQKSGFLDTHLICHWMAKQLVPPQTDAIG